MEVALIFAYRFAFAFFFTIDYQFKCKSARSTQPKFPSCPTGKLSENDEMKCPMALKISGRSDFWPKWNASKTDISELKWKIPFRSIWEYVGKSSRTFWLIGSHSCNFGFGFGFRFVFGFRVRVWIWLRVECEFEVEFEFAFAEVRVRFPVLACVRVYVIHRPIRLNRMGLLPSPLISNWRGITWPCQCPVLPWNCNTLIA